MRIKRAHPPSQVISLSLQTYVKLTYSYTFIYNLYLLAAMSKPDDLNVVTGATVEQEEWITGAQVWNDAFGIREPSAKVPRVVFPPTHTDDVQPRTGE